MHAVDLEGVVLLAAVEFVMMRQSEDAKVDDVSDAIRMLQAWLVGQEKFS